MEKEIRRHQETQNLRGQVIEVMEVALNNGRTVEKMRSMIVCLLQEHEHGCTDEFWKCRMVVDKERTS